MEHEQELRELTINSAGELGLTIEENHAGQFMRYLTHLIEWNRSINLTTIIDPREIIIKHFIDSIASLVATNFPQNCRVLDVGSGGGFPGIPLKIMRSDMRLVLVEPVHKKCSFLNSIIGLLQLQNVSTFTGTIEQYTNHQIIQVIDIIVLRALKYEEIRKYVAALLISKGKLVLYRTESIKEEEIAEGFHLVSETVFPLPHEFGSRVITVLEKND